MANKKFTSIKNDFCLTLGRETEIQECGEDVSILNNGFSFTSIELLKQTPGTATVDVIGVVFEIGPVGSIKMKSGELKDKLNVTIADDTKHSVPVTIWGNIANKLVSQMSLGSVVAFKQCRVSEYSGRTLNASSAEADFVANV